LLDQQGSSQDSAFIGAETLSAIQAFPTPSDATLTVVSGIKHFRVVVLAIRTPHIWVSPLIEHLLPPYMGVLALHPRTYGYAETNSSIDANSVQEDGWVIYLKIFIDILVYNVNMLNMGW
jgi:hypothetical protein